jgi:hypothetical protein
MAYHKYFKILIVLKGKTQSNAKYFLTTCICMKTQKNAWNEGTKWEV